MARPVSVEKGSKALTRQQVTSSEKARGNRAQAAEEPEHAKAYDQQMVEMNELKF